MAYLGPTKTAVFGLNGAQAALVALRFAGVIDWSWWFVMIPFELFAVLFVVVVGMGFLLGPRRGPPPSPEWIASIRFRSRGAVTDRRMLC